MTASFGPGTILGFLALEIGTRLQSVVSKLAKKSSRYHETVPMISSIVSWHT